MLTNKRLLTNKRMLSNKRLFTNKRMLTNKRLLTNKRMLTNKRKHTNKWETNKRIRINEETNTNNFAYDSQIGSWVWYQRSGIILHLCTFLTRCLFWATIKCSFRHSKLFTFQFICLAYEALFLIYSLSAMLNGRDSFSQL